MQRNFTASRPNQLWVADITYVKPTQGWVYAGFIIDVYSRMVIGWQTSKRLYTELALDALNMAIYQREKQGYNLDGVIHHSGRGIQYRSIRYSERLENCAVVAFVGSKGDSYDNALAEAFHSLYKAEWIQPQGPWRDITHVEQGTAEYINWYNTTRIHSRLDYHTPKEIETHYHQPAPTH